MKGTLLFRCIVRMADGYEVPLDSFSHNTVPSSRSVLPTTGYLSVSDTPVVGRP